ncbi:TOBE domain-containing protein [Bradyrhizobium sp. USDA 4529]
MDELTKAGSSQIEDSLFLFPDSRIGRATLVIRAEHVRIGEGPGSLPAQVRSAVFTGGITRLVLLYRARNFLLNHSSATQPFRPRVIVLTFRLTHLVSTDLTNSTCARSTGVLCGASASS